MFSFHDRFSLFILLFLVKIVLTFMTRAPHFAGIAPVPPITSSVAVLDSASTVPGFAMAMQVSGDVLCDRFSILIVLLFLS